VNQDSSENNIGLLFLTPLSTIFKLYRGGQVYRWRKTKHKEKTTTPWEISDKGGVQKHYRDSNVAYHHVNETSFTIRDIPEILMTGMRKLKFLFLKDRFRLASANALKISKCSFLDSYAIKLLN
jgi:hypothetical protein